MATELFTREGKPFAGRTSENDKGHTGYWQNFKACPRCGGAGGADKWKFTGWTCFECHNKEHRTIDGRLVSVVPANIFRRLYTADRLAKLNAAQAKADATRARKAAEAAAAEAARRDAEREAHIEAHKDIVARMAPFVATSRFLADMLDELANKVRPLTERQFEAINSTCAKMEAEAARRNAAAHVGTVGERITLNLTVQRAIDITEPYYGAPVRFIWVFHTDDGNTVIYYGGDAKALHGLEWSKGEVVKGGKVTLTATIKEHKANKKTGEPETVIQRPAAPKG